MPLLPPSPSQLEPAAPRPHARLFTSRELSLRTDPTALAAARDYVEQAVVAFGFDRANGFACVFAVNEALTNAIRYGAPGGEGVIRLRISAERDSLVFAIHSRGRFDAQRAASTASVPLVDRQRIPDASSEGGRGLPYMELLMDRVELDLRAGSTTVRLYKRVGPAAAVQAGPPGQPS
jgi:anti-sigma regulatory factor (Ser/Thr protein kinase)